MQISPYAETVRIGHLKAKYNFRVQFYFKIVFFHIFAQVQPSEHNLFNFLILEKSRYPVLFSFTYYCIFNFYSLSFLHFVYFIFSRLFSLLVLHSILMLLILINSFSYFLLTTKDSLPLKINFFFYFRFSRLEHPCLQLVLEMSRYK